MRNSNIDINEIFSILALLMRDKNNESLLENIITFQDYPNKGQIRTIK